MFGRRARLPVDVELGIAPPEEQLSTEFSQNLKAKLRLARELVNAEATGAQYRQATAFNQKLKNKQQFNVGDYVWLYNPAVKKGLSPKLTRPYSGPYRIVEIHGDVNASLVSPNGGRRQRVHLNRLRPCYRRPMDLQDPDMNDQIQPTRRRRPHTENTDQIPLPPEIRHDIVEVPCADPLPVEDGPLQMYQDVHRGTGVHPVG